MNTTGTIQHTSGPWRELRWFAGAYVLYDASLWIFVGDFAVARDLAAGFAVGNVVARHPPHSPLRPHFPSIYALHRSPV